MPEHVICIHLKPLTGYVNVSVLMKRHCRKGRLIDYLVFCVELEVIQQVYNCCSRGEIFFVNSFLSRETIKTVQKMTFSQEGHYKVSDKQTKHLLHYVNRV